MKDDCFKPVLTRYDDILAVVEELQRIGIVQQELHKWVTKVSTVDLDMLNDILKYASTVKEEDAKAA